MTGYNPRAEEDAYAEKYHTPESEAEALAIRAGATPQEGEAWQGRLGNRCASEGIGDITSDARGSGARFNSGKAPLHLIPAEILATWINDYADNCEGDDAEWYITTEEDSIGMLLEALGAWQRREIPAEELLNFFEASCLEEAAHVLDFGRKKYAEWNWAKGMPWSVPVGCIERHAFAIQAGEMIDPESGRTHWGHIVCNVIMLIHYERYYPEGDDRPPEVCFAEST